VLDSSGSESRGSQMVANDKGAAEAAPQVIAMDGAPRWNRTTNLLIKGPSQNPTEQHSEDLTIEKTSRARAASVLSAAEFGWLGSRLVANSPLGTWPGLDPPFLRKQMLCRIRRPGSAAV